MPRPDVSDLRREQILNAALALFSKKGIDSTSMSEIAKQCELSKATIYHYFDSKDDMVIALLNSLFAHDADAFEAFQNQSYGASQRLMTYAKSYATTVSTQPHLFAVFIEFYSNSIRRELIREILAGYFEAYAIAFTQVFQQGYENGEFQRGNSQLAADTFISLLEGVIIMSFIRKTDINKCIEESTQLFLNSLG